MKRKLLMSLIPLCIVLGGCAKEEQQVKPTHYEIYCDSHNGSYIGNEYTYCRCKNYTDMKKDLENKDIISLNCENVSVNSNNHIHYCVVYRDL